MNKKAAALSLGLLLPIIVAALCYWALSTGSRASSIGEASWAGVDEVVVERYAAAAGREAQKPLINTDSGDLLLFVFTAAGIAGGFMAGYCWRMLTAEKKDGRD
jgi:hypothetical protein